jgi:3-oxoacyl-[acyl-carrier protein] reductase
LKTALVTGGARRLGKHICLGLAKEGFDIALTYNSTPASVLERTVREISGHGVKVLTIKCDVTRVAQINRALNLVEKKFRRLDVLVNNAAIFHKLDFFSLTEKDFDSFLNTNLRSVFFFSQAAAKLMMKNDSRPCKIINISSMGAFENWTGFIPYSVAKAGVVKLTELLARKLAPAIVVNSIAPGTILIANDKNENVNLSDVKSYPMERFGNPNDIVTLVNYLATQNEFITGQTIKVDGGKGLI